MLAEDIIAVSSSDNPSAARLRNKAAYFSCKMVRYEYEKRPLSVTSCDSRDTTTTDWSPSYPSARDSTDRKNTSNEGNGNSADNRRDNSGRDSGNGRDSTYSSGRDSSSGISVTVSSRNDRENRNKGFKSAIESDRDIYDNYNKNITRDNDHKDSRRSVGGHNDTRRKITFQGHVGRENSHETHEKSRDGRGKSRDYYSYGNRENSHGNREKSHGNRENSHGNRENSHGNNENSHRNCEISHDGSFSRERSRETHEPRPYCPARRPLPPRPTRVEPVPDLSMPRLPSKTTVPLKVWIVASASCFAVCAALVLATVVITKWGATDAFSARQVFSEVPEPIYANPYTKTKEPKSPSTTTDADLTTFSSEESEPDIQMPILEKLAIFKNIVANRDQNKRNERKSDLNLASKPQIHPLHEATHHAEKKIEKKDHAKYPQQITNAEIDENRMKTNNINSEVEDNGLERNIHVSRFKPSLKVPEFKPKLPDVFVNRDMHMVREYLSKIRKPVDYEEYYNDENLYSDYMESNTMTSYLIEKVQELHDWITTDPDFEINANVTKKAKSAKVNNDFGQLLKALNESLIEGNFTIVMNKLKDIYFGENYTHTNHTRKVILSNSTDLLSFGILTLDIMLLHNIQLMAWENQEPARAKMLKDPEVFAFNALFLEPSKVEAKQNEVYNSHHDSSSFLKRQSLRQEDEFDIEKNLLENVLEVGLSTARAAIHLGRAYKNTKIVLNQLSNSNKEALNANIQSQISRNVDGNTHALHHLQTSFNKNDSAANVTVYTELDCVWLLYCKNLVATAKLNPPYGTMARINGMALRMLTGELSPERALDTMVYEALAGWTELRCTDMFPRCSQVDAASVVLESILAPMRKSQPQPSTNNRAR